MHASSGNYTEPAPKRENLSDNVVYYFGKYDFFIDLDAAYLLGQCKFHVARGM